jgi:predicted phage tail protein
MKFKQLKKELKEANRKLGIANRTVHDLMQEVGFYKELAQETADEAVEAIESQHEAHERQMQVAENEIKRLNVIIDFLYTRGRE